MKSSPITDVVTSFLVRRGRVLLLRRSEKVGTFRGCWAGVSGYLEVTDPERQARIEILEELGLDETDVILCGSGEPFLVSEGGLWRVYPFVFSVANEASPRLDWEHVELKWVKPEEISLMNTVPGLFDVWKRVSDFMDL